MQLDIQMLLDSFETPAVFYRENTVRYFNEWAKQLFPSIASGKGLPEGFLAENSFFAPEIHTMQKGTLYLLRPARQDSVIHDTARIVHELRGCLTVLTAATEQLSAHVPAEQSSLLERVNHSIYRLRRLSDHSDLLRQLEEGQFSVYREGTVDLAGLCRELSQHLGSLALRAGVHFRLDCTSASLSCLGDPALLQRMLLNLISNAMRAAGSGGEVCLRLEKKGNRALFTVRDNGSGMEPERLISIFRPQPRRHRLPKPEEGAALGLRLVREIIVLHQGLILAENPPEGGFSVTVSLPIRPVSSRGLHSTPAWGEDGFHLVLTELSDVLPAAVYTPEDMET